MKTEAIQKINKVGKISYILTVICKIFVIVGLVGMLVGGVVWLVLPVDTMKVTQSSAMIVEMNQEGLGSSISGTELEEMEASLAAGEQWQVSQVQSGMMGPKMFSAKTTYNPVAMDVEGDKITIQMLSEEASFTMRHMGVLMLLMSVVLVLTIVTLTFVEGLCKAFRDCESPFEEQVIRKMQRLAKCLIPWVFVASLGDSLINSMLSGGVHVALSLDLGVVLVVVIVLILVYVFKYGAVLQQESDETL